MSSTEEEGDWISLMDYATKYGVSLSTLRRHIKASKVQYRVENGRYLLRSAAASIAQQPAQPSRDETQGLDQRLRLAQEEITELKMLVALYEDQLSSLQEPTRSR